METGLPQTDPAMSRFLSLPGFIQDFSLQGTHGSSFLRLSSPILWSLPSMNHFTATQELVNFHVMTMAELGKHFGHFRELTPTRKPLTVSNRKVKDSSTTKAPCSQWNSGLQMRGCAVSEAWLEVRYLRPHWMQKKQPIHGGSSCLLPESKCCC